MYPTLYQIGAWHIQPYGVMLMLSFLLGVGLARSRARAAGIDPSKIMYLGVVVIIATLVGARLLFVVLNYRQFAGDLLKAIHPYQDGVLRLGGLVMNGGVVCSAIFVVVFSRWKRMPVLRTLDVVAPSVALGIFLTRIGCFLTGCCYGTPTKMPWGVIFPADSDAGFYQRHKLAELQPIHPTQLYSAAYGLAIFVALLVLERKFKRFDGFTALGLLALYSAARFVVEFFRHYYDESGVLWGLTHNQYLSIALMAGSVVGLVLLQRRQRCEAAVQIESENW
jgi:phosphatidylglycerol:prolipoprotein diacylglycerol transferase